MSGFKRPLRPDGFTLIEFLLALGVAVGVSAAVLIAYVPRQRHQELVAVSDALLELREQANKAYAHQIGFYSEGAGGTIEEADMTQLINAVRSAPLALAESDGVYTHTWGGQWELTVESSTCTPDCALDLLTQTLTEVPAWACIQLVNIAAPGMYDTRINSDLVALDPPPTATVPGRSETRPEQVSDLCQQTANTVAFRSLKVLDFTNLRQVPFSTILTPEEAALLNPQYERVENAMADREDALNGL